MKKIIYAVIVAALPMITHAGSFDGCWDIPLSNGSNARLELTSLLHANELGTVYLIHYTNDQDSSTFSKHSLLHFDPIDSFCLADIQFTESGLNYRFGFAVDRLNGRKINKQECLEDRFLLSDITEGGIGVEISEQSGKILAVGSLLVEEEGDKPLSTTKCVR